MRANKLVIVTGSGRSGTSTVAGSLKLLGLAVPQPEVKADPSNPRGFFEPRWVVDFHKRLLADAEVATLDARPTALNRTRKVADAPEVKRELRDWLERVAEPQFVVKDPRTFWLSDLWRETADSLGIGLHLITMLRHPTEVVGSRGTYYASKQDESRRTARETGLLAGWVNTALVNELVSRRERRVFVHYEDLLEDWRAAMRRVGSVLDLEFNVELTGHQPHPVDDFIDVNLHRVRLTWDDLDVPTHLRDLAEDIWQCLSELADPDADHGAAASRMDDHRQAYDSMYAYSRAIVRDATLERVRRVRRRTRLEVEGELAVSPRVGLPRRAATAGRRAWRHLTRR
jgi:hypothetical protein